MSWAQFAGCEGARLPSPDRRPWRPVGRPRLPESIDRLRVATDDDPVETEAELCDPPAPPEPVAEEEPSELEGEDSLDGATDPRELRFQLRRAHRKLKEIDLQAAR